MSAHIIIGNQLSNLTPDGPEWQTIEKNTVGAGAVAVRIIEKYVITRAAGLATVPAFGSANGTDATCLLRRVTEHTDKTGALWGVTLEFCNTLYDGSTAPIGPGETIYELDQAWAQVPIERASYWTDNSVGEGTLSSEDFAKVNLCITSGVWTGKSQDDGSDLGITGLTVTWEIPGKPETKDVLQDKAFELWLEKLKGNNHILKPQVVFRVTTTSYSPTWTSLTANAGKRVAPPVTVVTGSTANNWLYIAPRAERRKANNQVFFSQSAEYLYNPDEWDERFYE